MKAPLRSAPRRVNGNGNGNGNGEKLQQTILRIFGL
jgi:hypothetical protein